MSLDKENSIKIGAGAVIIKDGLTLLAKRKNKNALAIGEWGTMGGHMKYGESPMETTIREAREELGIEIGNLKFLSCTNLIKYGKHYIDISFSADIISGEPKICEADAIEEIGWYPLDNLPTPLFEPVRIALDAFKTGQTYYEINE